MAVWTPFNYVTTSTRIVHAYLVGCWRHRGRRTRGPRTRAWARRWAPCWRTTRRTWRPVRQSACTCQSLTSWAPWRTLRSSPGSGPTAPPSHLVQGGNVVVFTYLIVKIVSLVLKWTKFIYRAHIPCHETMEQWNSDGWSCSCVTYSVFLFTRAMTGCLCLPLPKH